MLGKISEMLQSNSPVLFDVGANKGEFTKHILESWKGKEVRLFVFEPSQKTYAMLQQAIPSSDSVHLINKGLSDKVGKVELYYDRAGSGWPPFIQEICHITILISPITKRLT